MALACEGLSFLKASIQVLPSRKEPLEGLLPDSPPLVLLSECVADTCWLVASSTMVPTGPSWDYSLQREEMGRGVTGHNAGSGAGKNKSSRSAGTDAEHWEADRLVHPQLKPVQLSSQDRACALGKASAVDEEATKMHTDAGLCGSDCGSPLSAGCDGSDFESCAGSPFGSTVSSCTWQASAEGTVNSPRSESGSLLGEGRRIETLEVQLAAKSSEIQRLADVCSGAEWALSEREKETEHLGALAQNLEEQIAAKDEVLELSQELVWGLEKRLVALEMERDACVLREGEYEQAVLTLQGELDEMTEQLEALRCEKRDVGKELEGREGLVRKLEKELREKAEANAALEVCIQQTQNEAAEKIEDLTRQVSRMQKKQADNAEALRVSAEAIGELKRQLQEKESCSRKSAGEYESAMAAQTELLRSAEKRLEGLERDLARKDGNLEAVGAHVADLQRQLEETQGECAQACASLTRLQVEVEASHAGATSEKEVLAALVTTERAGRVKVEAQLEAKGIEVAEKEALIAQLKEELVGRAYLSRLAPLPLAESLLSSWEEFESAGSSGGVLETDWSGSSIGAGQGDCSDSESVAETPKTYSARAPSKGSTARMFRLGPARAGPQAGRFGTSLARGFEGIQKAEELIAAERTATGLLGQLWSIVSRRCTRDVEASAPSSWGLKLLLPAAN